MKQVPMLIGLAGFKGSGKDTVADYLVSDFDFVRVAYADAIRRALAAMFEVPISLFLDREKKELPLPELKGKSPRFLAQTEGTEWGRDIVDPDLWVWLGGRKIDSLGITGHSRVVISDVRFVNEVEDIHKRGGVVWLIERPEAVMLDGHRSEKRLPPECFDLVLDNSGTKAMLYTKIGVIIDGIERRARGTVTGAPL